ncbi:DNA double-strand break repair nuclease NurA [Proteinivorax hydrogeniformans]|uniref:DNA double-strand break repair nuclease NurA n=1 Tax=Proteinivorax hydrogeniformans TaxID=1826727 RepID=A0AAU8HU04_9FIRM
MVFDNELIRKIKKVNEDLSTAQKNTPSRLELKEKLAEAGGIFSKIKENVNLDINLMGVDGSFNSYGANYPHQIFVFRALAKTTKGYEHVVSDVLYPMDSEVRAQITKISSEKNISQNDAMAKLIKVKLASMEVQAALGGLEKTKPDVIFMDGSLIRYKIEDADGWGELQAKCLSNDIKLGGVIEEIGTNTLSRKIDLEGYDRETLFNLFELYEQLTFHQIKEGLSTVFYRPSKDPHPVAMDCLTNQKEGIDELIGLASSLTPKRGRGIPVWLDIVDNEVRVTNKAINALIENHLDEKVKRVFLSPKRDKRII